MPGPFTGLTVLDFSEGQAGSIASLILADYGADVVKVERRGGDPFRFMPAWISWNRGKKSAVIDLETQEGRRHAIQLSGRADIIIESSRPGDMQRVSMDYYSLARDFPRLIYVSINGWGQRGPLRRVKGYEGLVSAKAGRMLNMQGLPNREGPVYSAVLTATWHASQAAIRGIVAALRVRDMTGKGQWVQTSLVQAMAAPHDNNAGDGGLVNRQLQRMDPVRFPPRVGGNRGYSSIGYIPVRTKDGKWLQHANQRVPHVEGHLKAIGLGHLLEDPRFKKVNSLKLEDRETLRREILKAQLTKTAAEWMDIYIKDGNIAAEPYRTSVEAMDHPAVIANNTVATINDPRVGPMRTLGLLIDLKDNPGKIGGPAPDVGQHTEEVLARLKTPMLAAASSPTAAEQGTLTVVGAGAGNGHTPKYALEGVTIVDLATVQAGPYGATLLADLGARVIKVDATDERVDENRRSTARELAEPRTYAGKECIQVDLQTAEGRAVVQKLIASADIVLQNYRMGVAERLGVGFEELKKINPRLVYVWMGTYGEKSVHAKRPGAHPIPGGIMGGPMRQMGRGMPPPPEQQMSMDDIVEATRWIMKSNWGPDQNTSGAVATACALGLRSRDVTGKAQLVHVTMLGANSYTNADEYYDYKGRPDFQRPDEEIHGLNATYRLYPCLEGWVFLGILFQDEWEAFCNATERTDLLNDPRFATREDRLKHDDELIGELYGTFSSKTAKEWEALLLDADVGCVQADEAVEGDFYADHPHAKENQLSVEVEHPVVGKYLRYGSLVELSMTPSLSRTSIQVGQHTRPLMREIGYDNAQIDELGKKKVVAWADPKVGGLP